MLDLTSIVFTTLMMLLIIIRAVQLDAREPWFGERKQKSGGSGLRVGSAAQQDTIQPIPFPPKGSWRDRTQAVKRR